MALENQISIEELQRRNAAAQRARDAERTKDPNPQQQTDR